MQVNYIAIANTVVWYIIMYAFMLHSMVNLLLICMYMYRTRTQRLATILAALDPCTYQGGTGNQLIQSKI